jgi:transposase
MDTTVILPRPSRRRRRHTDEFKAQVVAACLQPGVSIAGVALANGLNANLLRNWVQAHRDRQASGVPARLGREERSEPAHGSPPTLVPVTLQTEEASSCGGIRIEIRRQETVFQITWPASEAAVCGQWLREVLR